MSEKGYVSVHTGACVHGVQVGQNEWVCVCVCVCEGERGRRKETVLICALDGSF